MVKKKDNLIGDMIKVGMTNMVGVGLINGSSEMVNKLDAGTAKTMAGTAIGLQGTALLGPNLSLAKKTLSKKSIW